MQFVQELLSGSLRRNRFTQWELDLLLDLETSGLRKTSRLDALRRYQRLLQEAQLAGATEPPKFSAFLDGVRSRRAAAASGVSQ